MKNKLLISTFTSFFFICYAEAFSVESVNQTVKRIISQKASDKATEISKEIFDILDNNESLLVSVLKNNGFKCGKNTENIQGRPKIIRCLTIVCSNKLGLGWRSNRIELKWENQKYSIRSIVVNYSFFCPSKIKRENREKWVFERNPFMVEIK